MLFVFSALSGPLTIEVSILCKGCKIENKTIWKKWLASISAWNQFSCQVLHWHISPEQAWLILFWYGNTKVCYWTIHILDLIVPKHPDINDKWKNYGSSQLFAHLTIWQSDNLTIWPSDQQRWGRLLFITNSAKQTRLLLNHLINQWCSLLCLFIKRAIKLLAQRLRRNANVHSINSSCLKHTT